MKVPARLLIRTGSPPRSTLTSCPIMISSVCVGIVTEAGDHRPQPADVAVVVGAEHVDAALEAALALVEVVRRIGGEVRGGAVGLDEHPVLVVAEIGGAQPERAVGLVGVAFGSAAGPERARPRLTSLSERSENQTSKCTPNASSDVADALRA